MCIVIVMEPETCELGCEEKTSSSSLNSASDETSTKRMVAHSDEYGFSVFNVGEYRRTEASASDAVHGASASFFSPDNAEALKVRTESARRAMMDMAEYLQSGYGHVAIFDATNTTRSRRQTIVEFCEIHRFRCFFIESACDDERIIDSNVTDVKVNSPDYKGLMSAEQAKEDFMKRIDNYKRQYEPLDEMYDNILSFIKVINAGRSFFVHNVLGHVQSRVVYFLMNIHLLPRSIYLTRHGQSEYNAMGRLGGDSPLTEEGQYYARALMEFFENEKVTDLRIWCSQKVRAAQTAQQLKPAFHTEYWKALDEIDAGICEGLTYYDIQQRNVVANFLIAPDEYGSKKSGRRSSKVRNGEKRITMMKSNTTASVDEVRSFYCLTVSKTTVWRALKANPFIKGERMRKCPTLTADRKKVRMDFAHPHMPWTSECTESILPFFHVHVPFYYKLHFIQIIFRDEKKSSLDGPNGFTSYWRFEKGKKANVLVISHQAVLRCILAYFYDRPLDDLPYIDLPLHSLVKLTPRAYHCDSTIYRFDIESGQWSAEMRQLPLCDSPRTY
uniref:6PF2K domain-containing protein n=1 Tax=Heterorhabditis bacteriophora TaxID=37862 RepID=A0A1I7XJP2_HETBA